MHIISYTMTLRLPLNEVQFWKNLAMQMSCVTFRVARNVISPDTYHTRECEEWYQRSNIFFETVHPLVHMIIFTSKSLSLEAMRASHSTDVYVMYFIALMPAL